jgi:hypothetical protein
MDDPQAAGAARGQRGRSQSLECLEQWLYDQPGNIGMGMGMGGDGMLLDMLATGASAQHELEQGPSKRGRVRKAGQRQGAQPPKRQRLPISSFKNAKRQVLSREVTIAPSGKVLSQSFVLGGVGRGSVGSSASSIKMDRPLPLAHCGMASAICRMPLFTQEFRAY